MSTSAGSSKSDRVPGEYLLLLFDYAKGLECVDHYKLWKPLQDMGIPDHLTCLLRNCIQVKSQKLELGMEQKTGSKSEKEYVKVVYCHLAYLTYMQISVQFSSVAQCVQLLVTL